MTSLRGLRAFYLASISMIVVSIFIDAIGSPQTYQTDAIPAGPGQQIDVVVQQRLAMSHYSLLSP